MLQSFKSSFKSYYTALGTRLLFTGEALLLNRTNLQFGGFTCPGLVQCMLDRFAMLGRVTGFRAREEGFSFSSCLFIFAGPWTKSHRISVEELFLGIIHNKLVRPTDNGKEAMESSHWR